MLNTPQTFHYLKLYTSLNIEGVVSEFWPSFDADFV